MGGIVISSELVPCSTEAPRRAPAVVGGAERWTGQDDQSAASRLGFAGLGNVGVRVQSPEPHKLPFVTVCASFI
ncbi:uncharacterized protein IUM83_11161 [Phytophthora cinnamomi]|uniref:uncharacterized protein n=1 Tax=Phytophthora cinnamomi TaxID=4785 RepID=UPI0035594AE8|nr:hypothetical protein IUM83_11161 [Phytophthora cinnamomi]